VVGFKPGHAARFTSRAEDLKDAPSCGVPVGAVCVCVRVQDAVMLYVVRCSVLYVVCACLVPRTRARFG
jgi:hypothetical protein